MDVQKDDPSMMVLNYHRKSKEHGEVYRNSDLFKRTVAALEPYVAERRMIMLTNLD